jgi:DNA-binding MarR family transcriptional regulator
MGSPPASSTEQSTRWLDQEERAVWLGLARLMTKLPTALDAQLERDADLNYFEYIVMAMLSERDDRTLRMSQLAALTNASLSRLSHVAKRLEARGFVHREPDPDDGRYTKAILTEQGMAKVEGSAPALVENVRRLVFDALTPTQLGQLHEAVEAIVTRVDPGNPRWPQPPAI